MDVSLEEHESEGSEGRNKINERDNFMMISTKKTKQVHETESASAEAAPLRRAFSGELFEEPAVG